MPDSTKPPRTCQVCEAGIVEYGDSPWCESCGKTMCPSCERKHDKESCKLEKKARGG